MTAYLMPDAKAKLLCPLAKTFGKVDTGRCRGDACACWRWLPMTSMDPRFLSAVTRETAALKEDRPTSSPAALHKEAVKRVNQDATAYTYPDPEKDRGYCGLGGSVKG